LIAGMFVSIVAAAAAQGPADHPAVTVDGQTYTPASILARNMGSTEDQETAFPPHKVVGNVYYVGTRTLSSFLIVTAQGNVLIDTTYERNAGVIRKSVGAAGVQVLRREDRAWQPRSRRSSGRRCSDQTDDRRPGDGDGRGCSCSPRDEARRQGTSDRQ